MSQSKLYPIACPQCNASSEVELYDSINVQEDPVLRDALMENQLNAVTCASCGYAFRVDKPLLYSDPGLHLMIYWIPITDQDLSRGEEDFRDMVSRLTQALPPGVTLPEIHLVFSRTELVERIFLREAELNERIIEYIKYMILVKNIERIPPQDKCLLFNAEDSTDASLCFVVQDIATRKLESVIEYSRDAYKGICEMFDQDEQTATLFEMFPGPHINARSLMLQESEVQDY